MANDSDEEVLFKGLPIGIYTIRNGSSPLQISLNGCRTLNLADKSQPSRPSEWLPQDLRKIIGLILILAINLTGATVIVWIVRKG